jgi:hypothetical protein
MPRGAVSMIFDNMANVSLGLVYVVVFGGQHQQFGRRAVSEEQTNFGNVAAGFAGVAVSAYLLYAADADLGGFMPLMRFLAQPIGTQHWKTMLAVVEWLLLFFISVLNFGCGIRKPVAFDAKRFALLLAVLVGMTWLWLTEIFVPADWPASVELNLFLICLYVSYVAYSVAGLAVMLRSRSRNAFDLVGRGIRESEIQWRTSPVRRPFWKFWRR